MRELMRKTKKLQEEQAAAEQSLKVSHQSDDRDPCHAAVQF